MNVYPELPGITYERTKKPLWSTLIQRKASGMESRAGLMMYPLYEWTLNYEVLRGGTAAELETLLGFFNSCSGALTPFYFEDAHDKTVVDQTFGVGDGSTVAFQLVRSLGGFVEPVQSLHGTPTIKIDGSTTTALTIGDTGIVTFDTPPEDSAVLTWSGSYYWLCRFLKDETEFNEFMHQLFNNKKVQLASVKQ